MPLVLPSKEADKIARWYVCDRCHGPITLGPLGAGVVPVGCNQCGNQFTGWISKRNLQDQSGHVLDEVLDSYPELRSKRMRIKTLQYNKAGFPEIGQIRKGEKQEFTRKDGSTYTRPVDLDYFRVVFKPGEEAAEADFRRRYGDQPREINVRFPLNDVDKFWSSSLVGFVAGQMLAQSDGEIYQFLRDGETGEDIVRNGRRVKDGGVMPYDPNVAATHYIDTKGERQPVELEPSGLLKVMVPELGRAAYLTVVTNSWHDVETIPAHLDNLYAFTGGSLTGLPVVLKRRPNMISTPGDGAKRVRREKWLLALEVEPEYSKHRFAELEDMIYGRRGQLAAPVEEPALLEPSVGGFDHAEYQQHTTGQILDGEIEEEEREPDPLDENREQAGLWETVTSAAAMLDNYESLSFLFANKLSIVKTSRFDMLANRLGIDPNKDRELLDGILAESKGDFRLATMALLKNVGYLENRKDKK